MENDTYHFDVSRSYTRRDIFKILKIEDPGGGSWYTGYTAHRGDWFIFCGVGTPGRTGHDYQNRFVGNDLIWFGKTNTTVRQPAIRSMVSGKGNIYIFFRADNRSSFVFAGRATPIFVVDSTPVEVRWSFKSSSSNVTFPEEIVDPGLVVEGARKTIVVNVYERDSGARVRCIRHWGVHCVICGFDFEARYGEIGNGYIHVHHLRPLSEIGTTYRLDPVNDLRPVCPNCHAMLHQQKPAMSIEELRHIVNRTAGVSARASLVSEG